jgi:hypothetical protein
MGLDLDLRVLIGGFTAAGESGSTLGRGGRCRISLHGLRGGVSSSSYFFC